MFTPTRYRRIREQTVEMKTEKKKFNNNNNFNKNDDVMYGEDVDPP